MHSRRKRFALLKKLFKKGKKDEELCHHIPHHHCVKVPVEKCHDVQKCWDEPHQKCWQEPEEKCWDEPKQVCHQEPREKCHQVPHKKCHQVPHEHCTEEPREHCEYPTKLVAKKKCEKEGHKFGDKLKKLLKW